ncbi:MAG: 5'/3'-nucleotidase SurE [Spirochaetaceae bacterium]
MSVINWHPDRPVILVTNDDGIESPGIRAAVEAVKDFGHVLVAAPTTQMTAMARSLTGDFNDHFHRSDDFSDLRDADVSAWHINASPALVVHHALGVFFSTRYPDLVVSGINYGENLGNNVSISGTIGAAYHAAAHGLPAIAVSLQTDIAHHRYYGELDWSGAVRVTRRWADIVLSRTFRGSWHPPGGRVARDGSTAHPAAVLPFDVLKIDVPEPCPPGTEERLTRLSQRHYFFSILESATPDTPIREAITHVDIDPAGLAPDDDITAVAVDRVVSVTPLMLDNTAPLDEFRAKVRL